METPPSPPSLPVAEISSATTPASPPPLSAYASPVTASDPLVVSDDDRTMGMLIHLLAMLTGIVGVLILWLIKKDQSRFIDYHGKEALNFQLTLLLIVVASMAVGIVTFFGIFLAIPFVWLMGMGAFVLEIIACIAANRGEWHRYPLTIRFIS